MEYMTADEAAINGGFLLEEFTLLEGRLRQLSNTVWKYLGNPQRRQKANFSYDDFNILAQKTRL